MAGLHFLEGFLRSNGSGFLGELEPLIALWTSSANVIEPFQSSCSASIEPL